MSNFPSQSTQRSRFGSLSGELTTGLQAKVFGLLAFCFAFAGAGGAVGYRYVERGAFLPLFIAYIALIFGVQAARNKDGLNIALLYAATFTTGLIVGPVVESYVGSGAGKVVFQAAAITGGMTIGLSAYALTTKRNLSGLQPILFVALLGLLIASVANIWVGGSIMYGIISWAGAVLFSVMLVFDVNRSRYAEDTLGKRRRHHLKRLPRHREPLPVHDTYPQWRAPIEPRVQRVLRGYRRVWFMVLHRPATRSRAALSALVFDASHGPWVPMGAVAKQ